MYTIIWTELGQDKWDRLQTKEEVDGLLKKLYDEGVACMEDIWIFSPYADEYAVDYDEWMEDSQ